MGLPVLAPDERAYIEADIEAVRTATVAREAGISEEEPAQVAGPARPEHMFADQFGNYVTRARMPWKPHCRAKD
jgi:hypothetical protein